MPYLVPFDLETTNPDPFEALPVSYTLGPETRLVNPGIHIPPETTAIHGITDEMVEHAGSLESEMDHLLNLIQGPCWDSGNIIIGMNVSYDLTIMSRMAKFLGARFETGGVLDVLVIDRHFDKYRKGGRKLVDLCKHYDVDLVDAHSSRGDADACLEIFYKQQQMYKFFIPTNDDMALWYRTWLMNYSSYRVSQGQEPIKAGMYYWPIYTQE